MHGKLKPLYLPPRDRHEPHRVATQLELLFDLTSVIAIAAAAAGLHHAIAEGHAAEGAISYLLAFFAIWWAWMNYTWFASAYDNGSTGFRLVTMGMMFGALLIAAGVPAVFAMEPVYQVLVGYLLMRFGLVALWLMAARGHPERQTTCLRYALGITIVQIYWTVAIVYADPHSSYYLLLFFIGAAAELSVPVFAEKRGETFWHRHHIIERYGLLNIIVLGEGLLSVVIALQASNTSFSPGDPFIHIATAGAVVTFSLWWVYFAEEEHLASEENGHTFKWGYGHILIFASGAAVGSGFAALVDIVDGHHGVSAMTGNLAVAVPVAIYFLGLWLVRDRVALPPAGQSILPLGAVAVVLAVFFVPAPLEAVMVMTALTAAARTLYSRTRASAAAENG